MNLVKVFVAESCEPCAPIKAADVENGNLEIEGASVVGTGDIEVKLIDVTSEEGFPDIEKYHLESVPSAVIEDERGQFEVCKISYDPETKKVILLCGEAGKTADPAQTQPV